MPSLLTTAEASTPEALTKLLAALPAARRRTRRKPLAVACGSVAVLMLLVVAGHPEGIAVVFLIFMVAGPAAFGAGFHDLGEPDEAQSCAVVAALVMWLGWIVTIIFLGIVSADLADARGYEVPAALALYVVTTYFLPEAYAQARLTRYVRRRFAGAPWLHGTRSCTPAADGV